MTTNFAHAWTRTCFLCSHDHGHRVPADDALEAALDFVRDADGQIIPTHSIPAGLEYPGVGPEHAWLKDTGRADYEAITDAEALEAFQALARLEGLMPALESAHAVAYAMKAARRMKKSEVVVVGLCGRGDKDVHTVGAAIDGKGNGHP